MSSMHIQYLILKQGHMIFRGWKVYIVIWIIYICLQGKNSCMVILLKSILVYFRLYVFVDSTVKCYIA